MKKLLLIVAAFICSITVCNAQNYEVLYVEQLVSDSVYRYCQPPVSGVIIYGQEGCEFNQFYVDGQLFENDSIFLEGGYYWITFGGCDYFTVGFWLEFTSSDFFDPFPEPIVWKRVGESVTLGNQWTDWTWQWSNGETSPMIEVTEAGIYTVTVSDLCGSETYSVEVRDIVELYRATVDLETKLNKVTWQATLEQAEYISEVKVERDGMVVGTAPYEQGYFLDNIGSENAARNYRLTAIAIDGTECPIPSYQKGTLHVDYSPNASNPNKLNMAWTPPFIEEGAPISVSYFQICKYDPATGEVTVVDQLGANNTIGSYDVNLFDGGYAVVAAMFNEGKEYEELAFSNLTDFLVGIEENEGQQCRVYPNPAKDRFTVEGTGTMTVTNAMGQEIMTKEIDGKTTIELPQGLYFVKLGGETRKIVVE
jgi:hypothetical protein